MRNRAVLFNDAFVRAATIFSKAGMPDDSLMLRDIYGRIHFIINGDRNGYGDKIKKINQSVVNFGQYKLPKGEFVVFTADMIAPDSILTDPGIQEIVLPGLDRPIRFLDRLVVGQDWLSSSSGEGGTGIPRLVFFGLKGGVGRSTALTILAYELAKSGKRVLVIDFDLESPGLSSMLLPEQNLPDHGLVDWFVEDIVEQGQDVIPQMVARSPLAMNTTGEIRVVPAMGRNERYYISKLSRVFIDVPRDDKVERFIDRVLRICKELEEQEKPDIVLIDSRAGLHDLAAASIVHVATTALLFAGDTEQTWQSYRLLFSHWQSYPRVVTNIRNRIAMVQALFPESDQDVRADHFLQKSYALFLETIYDEEEEENTSLGDLFNFDLNDSSAPHFPVKIYWSSRFVEFDPSLMEKGVITDAQIAAAFGDFCARINEWIQG